MNLKLNNKLLIFLVPFILGISTAFSLPPYNYFFINFITLPILLFFLIKNNQKLKRISFYIGWMFGFGYFLQSLYWITNSLTFEEQFKILIPFALISIPLFLGLFYGVATLFISYFNLNYKFSSIIILSIALGSIEYIRSIILTGFPWNLFAYSLSNSINLIQLISFTGTYTFNLLCITVFLIPTIFIFDYKKITKISILLFFSVLVIFNFIYGSFTIKHFKNYDKSILETKIKIISPQIEVKRYFENENTEKIILELIKLSEPNNDEKTLFIFPEGVLSNIYLQDLNNYYYLFSENYSNKHNIIFGINSFEDPKVFNSMVLLDNNLSVLDIYKKNKLVPFGEFLPLENILVNFGLKKITRGYKSFSKDSERNVISLNNLKFLPLICYEIIYSGNLNNNVEDFDFILNISEDGWFGNSEGPFQHFAHSIFRSIEEGKNLIRSANNGISAHINPKGQIINQVGFNKKGIIEIKNIQKTKKTIYSIYGNKLLTYFLLIYILLFFTLKKYQN